MAEFDYGSVFIPVLLSIAASFGLFAATRFSKTSEGTLTGTVKIAHVELTIQGLERRLDERLERLEDLIKDGEKDRKTSLEKVYERLEKLEAQILLHSYRLNQMDTDSSSDRTSTRNISREDKG